MKHIHKNSKSAFLGRINKLSASSTRCMNYVQAIHRFGNPNSIPGKSLLSTEANRRVDLSCLTLEDNNSAKNNASYSNDRAELCTGVQNVTQPTRHIKMDSEIRQKGIGADQGHVMSEGEKKMQSGLYGYG